jgi:hypothetical protein
MTTYITIGVSMVFVALALLGLYNDSAKQTCSQYYTQEICEYYIR